MKSKHELLLSPIQVGDILLKNRMLSTAGIPHYIQGTEPYPTEKVMALLSGRARSGAAAVYINHIQDMANQKMPLESVLTKQPGRFLAFDKNDVTCQTYLCQLIDAIRYYGAIAVTQPSGARIGGPPPHEKDGAPPKEPPPEPREQGLRPGDDGEYDESVMLEMQDYTRDVMEPTVKDIQTYIDGFVKEAVIFKTLGFQMLSQHNAYMAQLPGQFLSTRYNHRTDQYGGDIKNRARFLVELFDAVKQTLGRDFPLELLISGFDDLNGITVEDNIQLAKLLEGKVDLLHIRYGRQDPQHPTGFTTSRQHPSPNVEAAAAIRAAIRANGGTMLVACSAGLHDPDYNERLLQEGKCDLIAMCRTWISEPEYQEKLEQNRSEDITPCVRCNKCHTPNESDKYRSYCTVNPRIGLEDKLWRLSTPVKTPKRIAIVGGGPAGMYAAMLGADRGHEVTLYERTDTLGGQLKHADYPSFKWPMADYKKWLIRQVEKRPIRILKNMEGTRAVLEREKFDAVIVATGASFKRPSIPGADGDNVIFAMDTYGQEAALPKHVVVIGGSEIGVETGMYLAENGHEVTVMSRSPWLAMDAPHAHYVSMLTAAYKAIPTFHRLTNIRYTAIEPDGVRYWDPDGNPQKIHCQLVVLATGAEGRPDDCSKLYGAAPITRYIGDCYRPSNVHGAISSAYAVINQL